MATNYYPSPVPENTEDLRRYINDELQRIRDEFDLMSAGSDTFLDISRGLVRGVSHINKFGANKAITADTEEDVWDGGGTYQFPTTADITHVHQHVDQVAMRGQNIEVQGLDANWEQSVEVIALNATDTTTLEVLLTPLIRVFRMKVLADVVGDQDIHATNVGETINYATMGAGNNQTLMAIYTVPAGKTAYLTNYYASQTDATSKTPTSTAIAFWAADRANGYEFQLKHIIGIPEAGNMALHQFEPYGSAGEKTDIKISALPTDQDANVAAGFDIILVDNA